jgi:Protein of unknown function (DUF2530)
MEPESPTDTQKSLPAPPPLPARLLALPPVIYIGTAIWFALFCVLLVLRYAFDLLPPIWLWTALAGWILGLIGLAIMWWQRTASRRGTRGAQPDL